MITVTQAWLGSWGPAGANPLDGAIINEVTNVSYD